MTEWGWVQIIMGGLGLLGTGGGLTAILTYRSKGRELSAEMMLRTRNEIAAEQREWREVMRREIDRLQSQCTKLTRENALLLRRIAELEGHNTDLKRDNDELEARVKELERELREKAA